ncbi:RNA-directed DNA polymerase, eukaryota [Tanacetum coccineum]
MWRIGSWFSPVDFKHQWILLLKKELFGWRLKKLQDGFPDVWRNLMMNMTSDDVNYNKPEELSTGQKENHSKDPFNIYELLNKKKDNVESEDKSEHSPQYPPGYTPKDGIETFCNNGENSKKECGEFSQGGHFKKSVNPRTGGSILNLMEELVKVGQTMGYNMDGCMNNMTEIIESQGVKEGEVIIMGDFNEVRCKSERFGSNFNVQGANVFNSFIVNAGLEEIPLGGCSFTWCHKSATKMSKLDRFLISENLMITCPNFTATSLERYLSDHRPILLRESHFDYGPTPFRFFHSWFEMEGFNKLVEDAWNEAPVDESNAMSNMMKKLKYLKQKIRDWNKGNMKSSKNIKAKLKDDLKAVDDIIDNGEGNDESCKIRKDA